MNLPEIVRTTLDTQNIGDTWNTSSRLQLLSNMGIQTWVKRDPFLFFPEFKLYPKCLVILSEAISDPKSKEYTVLSGMLKVLDLEPEALSIAWLRSGSDHLKMYSENKKETLNKTETFEKSLNLKDVLSALKGMIFKCNAKAVLLLGNFGDLGNLGNTGGFVEGCGNFWPQSVSDIKEPNRAGAGILNRANLGIYTSFHPRELQLNPILKKEAYQVLLDLKERLKTLN